MPSPAAQRSLLHFLILGAIQGVGLWLSADYWPSDKMQSIVASGWLGFLLAATLSLQLSLRDGLAKSQIVLSLLLGVLFAGLVGWVQSQTTDSYNRGSNDLWLVWWPSAAMLAYILIPFIQSWPARDASGFRYSDLYRHSWDNFFIAAVAGLVTLIYWLLITLWAYLFQMLGVGFFKQLFFSEPFAWISSSLVVSVGLRIGIQNGRVITTLREIALAICRLLLPMAFVISFLFALSLPFTGLQPIWDTGYSTPILVALVAAVVFLLNGVYQDGAQPAAYPWWLLRIVNAGLWLLPLYAVAAAYSLSLRIQQYGLTPDRIYSALVVLVALLYSLSYSVVSLVGRFNQPTWLAGLRKANQWIALSLAGLLVLIHSPVLNPLELSAANQFQRLLDGQVTVETFDYGALRFDLGTPGLHYLKRLEELQDDAGHFTSEQQAQLKTHLTQVQAVEEFWEWERLRQDDSLANRTRRLEWINPPQDRPDSLDALLEPSDCRLDTCYVLAIDLNRDNQPELTLLDADNVYRDLPLFARDESGNWYNAGTLAHPPHGPGDVRELVRQLRAQEFGAVPSAFDDLRIGEYVLEFRAGTVR